MRISAKLNILFNHRVNNLPLTVIYQLFFPMAFESLTAGRENLSDILVLFILNSSQPSWMRICFVILVVSWILLFFNPVLTKTTAHDPSFTDTIFLNL